MCNKIDERLVKTMASIHYGKIKGAGQAKAWMRHCATEERKKREHRNEDVDKTRTSENVDFLKLTYAESCKKYDDRIKELDESTNTNKRRDRVTLYGLIISMPSGLSRDQEKRLMEVSISLFGEKYGWENIMGAYGHWDEIHEYARDEQFKSSRAHLHLFVVPEISGRLCGKEFSSKKAMKEMNRAIDRECYERFGKHFLTGEKPERKTVEELKTRSSKEAEILWNINKAIRSEQLEQLSLLLESRKGRSLVSQALSHEIYVNLERTR